PRQLVIQTGKMPIMKWCRKGYKKMENDIILRMILDFSRSWIFPANYCILSQLIWNRILTVAQDFFVGVSLL
ncbi:MAG TPA: hypothetical protein PKV71_13850, partial [Calditrichia bacterium]|nr:hypothetical protein [Calditrichia bacterium]